MNRLFTLMLLSLATALPSPAQSAATPVLSALQAELDRSMATLKSQPAPPYFLSYEVTEKPLRGCLRLVRHSRPEW